MRLHKETFSGTLVRKDYLSPVGRLGFVVSNEGVRAILCENDLQDSVCERSYLRLPEENHPTIVELEKQLNEYFDAKRKLFDIPLDMVGTPFQLKAWDVLCSIPMGMTFSYGQQAIQLGSVNKSRAVGGANSKNPISIVVPCHRVIGANGALTGFAGGIEMKRYLLNLEAAL